ncbi:hypothetical protein FLL94_02095 [Vibrio cholerae]|uniref:hypothetical protein n=1 Tax=Vibrio cholerae TaxID=666 RepID=UPI001159DD00|nr:hypothetical protein [Vibrio cholerae]TQP29353.1 hypothetical protein FLL94_02095 [Vibrio cholerae]
MSKRSNKSGAQKLAERKIELRNQLWGEEINNKKLWNRNSHDGYTTLPRTLPYIGRIMDREAGKGTPVSGTYLALWCNVFDDSFLEIKDQKRYAFESGFSGERAVTTWAGRMRKLEEMGFIESRHGTEGDLHYILLMNPLAVCKTICKEKNNDELYNALLARMNAVGAKFDESE